VNRYKIKVLLKSIWQLLILVLATVISSFLLLFVSLFVSTIYDITNGTYSETYTYEYQVSSTPSSTHNFIEDQNSILTFNIGIDDIKTDHEVEINADRYIVVNESLIPTGELRSCAGTAMDFSKIQSIGSRFDQVDGGYDHCYVLNKKSQEISLAAKVKEPKSGRTMEVWTTEPGVQFYTGNFLDGTLTGINGIVYKKNYGFCFEAQHFPDSPNQPDFPSSVLKPGETYKQTTIYKFSVQ
jgi:aldose 1-epimerase